MTITTTVRHAAHSTEMSAIARWGLAARATIYLLIGLLAAALASGDYDHEADQRGALQELTRHTGGRVLVWVILIGLAGYALWRFSEAAFGTIGEGRKVAPRLQSFARGLIYTFFAVGAFNVLNHSGSKSQAGQQELWTAKAMTHTGGRWAVGIVGVVIVVCGVVLVGEGITRKFEKYLALGEMSDATRRGVVALGVVGTIARGLVFALAGIFVIQAAWKYDPGKARGLDGALRSVLAANGGRWLLYAIAVGLVAFGVYGFAESKWRRT
jgi:hypothetical protein